MRGFQGRFLFLHKYHMSTSFRNFGNNASFVGLTKAQKRDRKLGIIAAPDRQHVGSNSYRPYNQYTAPGTHSPTELHPFTLDTHWVSGIGANAVVL